MVVDLLTLLEMVASGMGDRVLIGSKEGGLTGGALRERAAKAGQLLREQEYKVVVYLAGNGVEYPVALFGAAAAGVPFLPVNYRLSDEQLEEVLGRQSEAVVVSDDPERVGRLEQSGRVLPIDEFFAATEPEAGAPAAGLIPADPDDIAILLMTSGTTAAPKSAVLRHTHLTSYILSSVEFMSASETDAAMVSVPPYHIAAVANLLSNLYSGRRVVYLDRFTPQQWLDVVEREEITNAMVVPTMLQRIVAQLQEADALAPSSLKAISYGGAKVTAKVVLDALERFPAAGFVNAYGLTETSSSIAVLGPDDHRQAQASDDPAVRARLGSVGRALPGVEIQIQDELGSPLPAGTEGFIMVRGPQVAGEYLEGGSRLDGGGWFSTRDRGYVDDEGFIFVLGRADDTIIRGGENIAPAEIEEVLIKHPAISECAVAGVPDDEWGQRIAAFVVVRPGVELDPADLRAFAKEHLRSSKSPDHVRIVQELPATQTGKILRRVLVQEFAAQSSR